uniref:Uncharacterized protein n=1 Tax=Lutzomyia longipalpis TaxID=7200 RepID=A0A1B0CKL3_LUTLO
MFSRISNKTLAKVAVYGAFGSISAVFYMRWSIERQIRGQEFYKEALNLLKQHKGAETVLGNPISESGFDLSDKTNKCNSNEAHFEVSVRGPKDRGTYFFWARHAYPYIFHDPLSLSATYATHPRTPCNPATAHQQPSSQHASYASSATAPTSTGVISAGVSVPVQIPAHSTDISASYWPRLQ